MLMPLCMSGPPKRSAEELVLSFFDASRAHFRSPAQRKIVVRTPKEDLAISSGYAVLGKAMYGTKDAGACFDARVEAVMRQCGYTVGTFSVCLYFHPETREKVLRHGDDFIHLGTRQQAKAFHEAIGKELLLKHVATLGPTAALGDAQEVRCLNRILRWVRPPFGKGEERIE